MTRTATDLLTNGLIEFTGAMRVRYSDDVLESELRPRLNRAIEFIAQFDPPVFSEEQENAIIHRAVLDAVEVVTERGRALRECIRREQSEMRRQYAR